ncbi:MAG: cell surface protein SprA [Prevotella sp.]|nr:cell surface protein SprA [Prevotella sp.]
MSPQDDKTQKQKKETAPKEQPVLVEDEDIPDSLLHPRWKIKRTTPILVSDLDSSVVDLRMPENIKQQAEYDDSTGVYLIGSKIGSSYLNAPILMTPEEYQEWSRQRELRQFFRQKNAANFAAKGKDKFDFADMHFDLGPAEKIFGPGGVRIKTQGTAELKLGANFRSIDNPSLPERNRKTKAIDFDEKINLNVTGKVGDKVNMNLNYNTDATFDFDTKNIKLRYEGKEDEIIKLIEAGNVTFPTNNSLVKGASSLFGVRTDMQFGKLKLQTVFSQKKSTTTNVSSNGGVQLTPFELNVADYEENRHFFLAKYFREHYDDAMQKLPNLMTGIQITRVEVWVTNKTGTTANTRNIVAFTDLGESTSSRWGTGSGPSVVPGNQANDEYNQMVTAYADARLIDQTTTVLDNINDFAGSVDYEKLSSARLLNSSEYTVNQHLGYISLKTSLQTDQVLAVAYEFTYGGQTYQVGEFASDRTNVSEALFVKSLKNTSNNPQQKNWPLMMKNVYYLASNVEKTKFRLDIKFQSDTAGVYLTYIPEVKDITLLRGLGCDRLDNNNKAHSNGYFDYVQGYTVSEGRVFFPTVEPFGKTLRKFLENNHVAADKVDRYAFEELYDTTRTAARQMTDKNKYLLVGQFKGTSANVISLGAYNVPQGSVVVTAGGVILTEGADYSVDYSAGEVTILNQSIIDAGTNVSVSLESNTDYGMQRKTMLGLNWEYDFSKDLQIGGTIQHLSEQTLTSKVTMGAEPLRNTLWGVNINWKHESQWLTNMLNKLPFLHCTQPSQITFTGEFAQLIAGQAGGTQDNASYIDDFENAKNAIDVSEPKSWVMSSVPSMPNMFPEYNDKDSVTSGFNRALLSWYNIDPLFTYRSSSLTPSHIKSDLEQLSNHYVRAVYVSELYPNRQQSTYSGATATLPILNLSYYPQERGAYNLTTDVDINGLLNNPQQRWGGMMRKLDTNDFETANVEYIEFWLLDPFIYTSQQGNASEYGGDLYIDLGEVSEDILRDGKKFYESGMPVDGTGSFSRTAWGKVPIQPTQTYAFATSSGARAKQDVGLNGLNDEEERAQPAYANFLNNVVVNDSVRAAWNADPANDNYHYFRGSDLDERKASILDRYKRINMPQGNSPDSDQQTEGFDTSYKTFPDVEDINQDYTLNEYERYYQYRISIRPEDMQLGYNHITDIREASVALRNGNRETVKWYQFRIPVDQYDDRVGNINDFTSIRFMRMFLTQFKRPIVLRFGSLDLVRGEWRVYQQQLSNGAESGTLEVSAVNIEENNDKQPVNYVLPPGISRATDPSQPQLVEENEQSMDMVVRTLSPGESKAVYKNTHLDLRRYKHLQMFTHANHLIGDADLRNGDLAVFIRLGNDYKNNYYEYEIPLSLTPDRNDYNKYNVEDCRAVWPEDNMLDMDLSLFTSVKKERNKSRAVGGASFNQLYSISDPAHPDNTVSIMGNPSLGEVKTMMIGVRNISSGTKSGEVWVNELRLMDFSSKGGWAASGALNVQLSDVGTFNMTGKVMTAGFGGLEEGVLQRSTDDYKTYSITANVELGKFFPDKAKVSAPLYYSVTKEEKRPKYNPLDTDMELDDALDGALDKHERDSIESIVVTKTTSTNFSLSNVRVGIKTKRHPMPYDPANFSFSYSHSHRHTSGETTVYEKEDQWRGSLNYNYSPVYKSWEPFKKMKSKSKWAQYPKQFGLNWLPQNITFNTEMMRSYYELQERDMEDLGGEKLPVTFSSQFLWNREFSIRWDLTKNLHLNFQSATHAEIEEPYDERPINKDLYPDRYEAWKDSVWYSIRHFGTPLDYQQSFTASLQLPLNKIPIFDWVTSEATYNATYNWIRGTDLENGTTLGNTIANNRQLNINGNFNMETLYNHIPFLKKTNERFRKAASTTKSTKNNKNSKNSKLTKNGKDSKQDQKESKILPKNQNAWQKEVTLLADSSIIVNHGKKSKKLSVTARTKDGKKYSLKYKVLDDNRIRINNRDTIQLMLSIAPKPPSEKQWWYKPAQSAARLLMMVRSIGVSYRNQYAMSIPGFLPNIGDAFGQRTGSVMAPGLGFAFGLTDDSYLQKAHDNGWLLENESVATPATTNMTNDLQIRATLEPVRDLKIDLNASRTETKARSIQYMYEGMPTTQSGTFTMTTISLKSSLESIGDANNGFRSASFDRFCSLLTAFQQQAEATYGTTVDPYSASVMIPAFLSAYTSSGGGLSFFPALTKLLPNWTIRYTGLSKLPWFRDVFKSVTLNHSYKSIYAVGSYSTNLGNTSLLGYNVPTVSLNESFSPLLGIDVTFHNNLTAKVEYRTTRVLNLSMTSVQINESRSNDWVVGLSYKISDFNLFGSNGNRKVKKAQRSSKNKKNADDNKGKTSTNTAPKTGVNHDLNLRLDFSLRNQAAITRDIATQTSAASSGNTALKISFMADYTLSRLLTLSAYYDRQTNTPLLSSSSYPTTTHDFGLSLKFSLTR